MEEEEEKEEKREAGDRMMDHGRWQVVCVRARCATLPGARAVHNTVTHASAAARHACLSVG